MSAPGAALRDFIARHAPLAVLTGAGVSTDSGIPAYRDAAGAWRRSPPVTLQAFLGDPAARRRYWARSAVGWPRVAAAQPNAAHRALVRLEQAAALSGLITQNVDGLHQAAGHDAVIDLHGRLDRVRCLKCGQRTARAELQKRLLTANPALAGQAARAAPDGDSELELDTTEVIVPDCVACGGMLKPDVVFFGENVPVERVAHAMTTVDTGRALLVLGSSLTVYSGLRFVDRARVRGLPVAAVNLGRTRADECLDLKIEASCAEALAFLPG